jgi:signal transduction histidine kinase
MALHDVIARKRSEVMQRWKVQVQGALAPENMPALELVDHIPAFVDEIVVALKSDSAVSSVDALLAESRTAAGHGGQRLRLGFSIDSVVREYGALRDAIVGTARDEDAEISFQELQVLFDCIVNGIAYAVTEYARQRDAELLRQGNEHFAFIAHELRNPLSSATVAFELLKNGGQLPAESRSVEALERSLRRTNELIDQTLQIARVASGIQLRRQWTTLRPLFEDVALEAVSEAEARGVELRVTIEEDDRICIDIRLVRSALGNLVRNGVKYTSSGSMVELRGKVSNGRAFIKVEDCCGGLPPGKVEEAFAPFVRLDSGQSGFGLGLAIAKQAVEAHGGSIRVQNLPGKGCIFVLELPVAV